MTERAVEFVGFWNDPVDPETRGLPEPQHFVDERWSAEERRSVIDYLKAGKTHLQYRGYAWCRFRCGIDDAEMGSRDVTDGTWVWPEGYAHYLEAHDVKPPDDFLEHVRARVAAEGALLQGDD